MDDAFLQYVNERREERKAKEGERKRDECDHFGEFVHACAAICKSESTNFPGTIVVDEMRKLDNAKRRLLRKKIMDVIDDFAFEHGVD